MMCFAGMAESVDAADSKSAALKSVGVRVPLPAPASWFRRFHSALNRKAFNRYGPAPRPLTRSGVCGMAAVLIASGDLMASAVWRLN